jgi:hypothetical protein
MNTENTTPMMHKNIKENERELGGGKIRAFAHSIDFQDEDQEDISSQLKSYTYGYKPDIMNTNTELKKIFRNN